MSKSLGFHEIKQLTGLVTEDFVNLHTNVNGQRSLRMWRVHWHSVSFLSSHCHSTAFFFRIVGCSPTGSSAKDYFKGYARYHGNSIIFWIKHGWIQSQGVLRFHPLALNAGALLHAKEALYYNIVPNSVWPVFFFFFLANKAYKNSMQTVPDTIIMTTFFNAAA